MEIIVKICILIIFCLIGLLLGGCIKKPKPELNPEDKREAMLLFKKMWILLIIYLLLIILFLLLCHIPQFPLFLIRQQEEIECEGGICPPPQEYIQKE